MKKLFTFLTLLVAMVTSAWADDTYTVSFATNPWTQSTAGYFTSEGAKNNLNTKFVCKYDGTDYSQGLKMEDDTKVQFTTTRTFDITIVRSMKYGGTNTINFGTASGDKSALTFGSTLSDDNNADVAVATLTDQTAGTYQIVRGSGEAGIVFVSVTEKGSSLTKLSTPEINYVAATGTVTIGSVTNATKVTYTTDGTAPTASSDTYSAPFVVEDGTVVKAIAIGDGVSYSNSDVASKTVYMTGFTCATPVIKKFNGSVAITTTTPNATIKYSLNDGAYNTYTRSFTLPSGATVKAYAERTGCTKSSEASLAVSVLATNKTKTIYLVRDDFNNNEKNSAEGKSDTDAEGFTLTITGNNSKNWSYGSDITTPNGAKSSWKLSNGAQNTLTIPEGVHVTKITFYSYVNSVDAAVSGWKEVAGADYQTGETDYANVPMDALTNVDNYNTIPDVRAYEVDKTGGSITFTNAGRQLCFVIALDILEDNATATIGSTGWATFCTGAPLDFTSVTGLKAYIVTGNSGSAITTTQMTGTVPANTPLLLEGTTTAIPVAASSSTDVSANKLKAGTGAAVSAEGGKTKYVLSADGSTAVFKKINATAATVAAGKAYLEFTGDVPAPMLSMGGETTGINAVNGEGFTVNGSVYDLQGRRVAQPTKGLYIVNGRKVVIK